MRNRMVELQIILGFNCNFACKHCLNSSRPDFTAYYISDGEIETLAKVINSDLRIDELAFNGGEPLLYLDQMIDLKNRVKRQLHWSMTSNASLLEKSVAKLKMLNLDSAILSYDVHHEKFLNREELSTLIETAKTVIPKIEMNFVYENMEDFLIIEEIANKTGINILPTRLISSGRAQRIPTSDLNPFSKVDFSCPNLKEEKVKISYVPRRGYTLCCGPLVFDQNLQNLQFFSRSIDEVFQSPFYKVFDLESAESQIMQLIADGGDVCNACTKTFKKLETGQLDGQSIEKLNRKFLKTQSYLSAEFESYFRKDFHVKYLIRLDPEKYQKLEMPLEDVAVCVEHYRKLNDEQLTDFRDFTVRSFYLPYANEYNEKDIQEFVSVMPIYFNGGAETETFFFRKNNGLVAVLTLYHYLSHPYFQDEAYHIGYWGYDKAALTLDEARFVKASWNNILRSVAIEKNIPVVGLIDYFNFNVREMVSKFGFDLKAMRLDKRP